MKFGRYLRSHTIAEWNKAYINYRLLKKQIGKAALELVETQDEEDANQEEEEIPRTQSPVKQSESDRDLERGEEADAEGENDGPSSSHNARRPGRAPSLAISSGSHQSQEEHSDAPTHSTDAPLFRRGDNNDAPPSVNNVPTPSSPFRPPLSLPSVSLSRVPTRTLTKSGDFNPKRYRPGFPTTLTLTELEARLPPQSKKFFILLDKELDRISAFYREREDEAIQRFAELSSQWKELASHKTEFKAFRAREANFFEPLVSRVPGGLDNIPGASQMRRRFAQSAEEGAKRASLKKGDPNAKRSSVSGPQMVHGRPEEYTAARSKLKLASFEYYRSLAMLKSYRILNRTGFAKALKKFEKSTRIPCANIYTAKIDKANFVASNKLDDLMKETEDAFTTVFEHGDRKKALGRLRMESDEKSHHFASWRAGMLMGLGLPLLIQGLVKSGRASTATEIPYWTALLQLFGAMVLPIIFSLLFYLNLIAWHYARINYVLIFELDLRNRLDYRQFLEIPATLFFIFSLFFWAAFENFWPRQISPSSYPLAFLVVALFLMCMPFPYFYRSARWWMIRSFMRVISAGLVRVEFRDFFLGDELNSLYYCVYNLGFLFCTYNHGWPNDVQAICSTNSTWASAVLASLPALWRLGQSIRRYIDSDGLTIHALNAGKYTASVAYFFFYFNWRIYGSQRNWSMALWILSAIFSSCYTSAWDILMDWNLLRKNDKHPLLRPELGFATRWIYYAAMGIDVLLRFTWVIYLSRATDLSVQLRGFMVALIEVFRRIMWNGFRVESEHVGNVDGYRVTRNIPLPYLPSIRVTDSNDYSDDNEESTARQRFFSFFHRLHKSLENDLAPLLNVRLPGFGGPRKDRGAAAKSRSRRSSTSVGQKQADYGRKKANVKSQEMGSGIVESSTPASDSDGVIDSDSDVESDARHNKGKNTAATAHQVGSTTTGRTGENGEHGVEQDLGAAISSIR